MTAAEFRRLVADMRKAQRDYFANTTSANLDRAKRLEREVDHELKDAARGPGLGPRL